MPPHTHGCASDALRAGTLDGLQTVQDVSSLLAADAALGTRVERTLMDQPEFAELYRQRARATSTHADCANWPAGSLGAVLCDFRAWYGLVPDFFPVSFAAQASPLEFAASLLARDHDAYHVLCEYETSDADEVALQSFLCGQAPVVFACFVTTITRCPELGATGFKHLRDLLDSELDREAFSRGREAHPLITLDLSGRCGESLASLRRSLAIEPRRAQPAGPALRNTCGGKRVAAYFRASGI
jgi:ubiquinone biosynthesis protein COQ4